MQWKKSQRKNKDRYDKVEIKNLCALKKKEKENPQTAGG